MLKLNFSLRSYWGRHGLERHRRVLQNQRAWCDKRDAAGCRRYADPEGPRSCFYNQQVC